MGLHAQDRTDDPIPSTNPTLHERDVLRRNLPRPQVHPAILRPPHVLHGQLASARPRKYHVPIWYPQYMPGSKGESQDGARPVVRPTDDLDRAPKHLQQKEASQPIQDARLPRWMPLSG